MNILVFNAYYTPETAASLNLEEDIAEGFAKQGNQVTMYVPTPSRGVSDDVRAAYKKRKIEFQHDKRLKIVRYGLMKEGRNPVLRAMRYVLQNIKQYRCGIRTENVDVIFSGSTPPTQGAMCALVKKKLQRKNRRYIPFVFNLQDIFPDSLVNAGMTREGSILWKIGRKIENFTYRNADSIIVISEGFKQNIMKKGVPEEKITVVSNWIDVCQVHPIERCNNKLFDEFNIDRNKFIVTYAGNFGGSQGAMIVLKAAELLVNEEDIKFVIFGGGSEFKEAINYVYEKNLNNVFIHGLLPPSRISEVYSMGDVSLITAQPGVGNAGMPSKTWSIMACNTPIIASFDLGSDLEQVLQKSRNGYCVPPGDANALSKAIVASKEASLQNIGGREYVIENASKEICVKKYVKTLEQAVEALQK